jgi:hypothetical protein
VREPAEVFERGATEDVVGGKPEEIRHGRKPDTNPGFVSIPVQGRIGMHSRGL